ncbi:alpha-glucuronidase family glycosyl hydrolase [Parvularcula sp. LCG005]|uniref:alpha-glucuronidase family glycosyl hydrolase n=1 Tax=Parvularcula sp. LCG005 TaxID=3078805 RepID=UPI002943ED66|nr:alpha-glucuronidase family glycosyl hydrolase [Parvularcula sp. LCG005]WOI53254.1 alpha-glucuronidase family glycosyl hydrolase [Parvularcula sp. LCG005]
MLRLIIIALSVFGLAAPAQAEDGYELWLRYPPMERAIAKPYRDAMQRIILPGEPSETLSLAISELERGATGMLDRTPSIDEDAKGRGNIWLVSGSDNVPADTGIDLTDLAEDGYVIRTVTIGKTSGIVIASKSDVGVLYGTFHLLRLMQTRADITELNVSESPSVDVRIMNHWDNLDRYVERGYSGQSIWDWHKLPDYIDPRYEDYARAQASIGINGVSLINVNSDAMVLTPMYLEKTAALADVFRPYGIKVYQTARFSAPMEIGGLETADPADPAVQQWWAEKADEIYQYIPDFGGFLVKANSEGQPGPQDYGRNHVDGANMLADALAPHGGIVMWRAFVYSEHDDEDRAKQAYTQFVPLDGQFRDNVLVQVKNGAIDFQPREPFHPMFGAMPETPLMMEFQVTKEYLGFATHLVYLAPLYEEVLEADTYAEGEGSTVASVVDGSLQGQSLTGVAGVGNVGSDRNWSGSHFDQANWYAFGRMAWDLHADSEAIADDWVRMTFSNDPAFVTPVVDMMMGSREAAVNYMTPLGLAHLMATGHHYGPGPWVCDLGRPEWNPCYYHKADENGIGFDRTETGSDAISQYAEPLHDLYGDIDTVPENLLLWFHHVPWDHEMKSGATLWEELTRHYTLGVEQVADMRATWAGLEGLIDDGRYAQIAAFLGIQEKEAQWWRDSSIAYFQSISGLPLPDGLAPPEKDVEYYKAISHPFAPGN